MTASDRQPAILKVGERFVWPESDRIATVERVTPCAAYVRLSGGRRHVEIRDAAGDVVREFDAEQSKVLAITAFCCVERIPQGGQA